MSFTHWKHISLKWHKQMGDSFIFLNPEFAMKDKRILPVAASIHVNLTCEERVHPSSTAP